MPKKPSPHIPKKCNATLIGAAIIIVVVVVVGSALAADFLSPHGNAHIVGSALAADFLSPHTHVHQMREGEIGRKGRTY
ncbi:hypothetical protein KDH_63720 [Dictyobacter sp. S3.2.2.5]|uniref:PDGLE domain-containing protein n=1 Tax=Dictyobacter halimunensis TaxID=3026934 RepID=A0ABQ6G109_9CHLR|nr:hypothetical protein KDH_63720 [Dictyobacter sp. S3.2.2.5]